jgi:uncharacterized protein YraI
VRRYARASRTALWDTDTSAPPRLRCRPHFWPVRETGPPSHDPNLVTLQENIMRQTYRWLGIALLAAWPLAAAAQEAYTLAPADVFAGPSSEYPQVATLPPNTQVHVNGCLSSWSWCDVDFSGDRGWVYATDLGIPFHGDRVAIIDYGPQLGLPVVSFSLVTYWDAHYHGRPWFAERDQWSTRVAVEGTRGGPPPQGHAARGAAKGQAAPSAQPGRPESAQTGRSEAGRPESAQSGASTRTQPPRGAQSTPQAAQPAPRATQPPQQGTQPQGGQATPQSARPEPQGMQPQGTPTSPQGAQGRPSAAAPSSGRAPGQEGETSTPNNPSMKGGAEGRAPAATSQGEGATPGAAGPSGGTQQGGRPSDENGRGGG